MLWRQVEPIVSEASVSADESSRAAAARQQTIYAIGRVGGKKATGTKLSRREWLHRTLASPLWQAVIFIAASIASHDQLLLRATT